MVKCALVLCHSNADVERSLSVNKRMLTKQNVGMKDETLRGLRAIKDAVKHAGGITNIAVSLDMIKAAEKSRSYYAEYLRKEKKKKRRRTMRKKRRRNLKREKGSMKKGQLRKVDCMQSYKNTERERKQ